MNTKYLGSWFAHIIHIATHVLATWKSDQSCMCVTEHINIQYLSVLSYCTVLASVTSQQRFLSMEGI